MGNRPVAEIAFFAEELAVVRGHDHPRVLRQQVEELLEDRVQIDERADLSRLKLGQLLLVENAGSLSSPPSQLEDAVQP